MKVLKFLFLFISIFALNLSFGQDYLNPSKHTIARTVVRGVDHLNHEAIVLISGLTPGKEITVPGDDISQAIKKLWEQDLFSDVAVGYDKIDNVSGDIFLYIELKDRPKLTKFKFIGDVSKSDADKIRDIIDLYNGKTVTESLKRNTINQINAFYQDKGFYKVETTIEELMDTTEFNSRIFEIDVTKGKRIKIKHINFYNN